MILFWLILLLFHVGFASASCPNDTHFFDSFEDKWFYSLETEVTWTQAVDSCNVYGGLATFENNQEFQLLVAKSDTAGKKYHTALSSPVACQGTACNNQLQWHGQSYPFTSADLITELSVNDPDPDNIKDGCLVLVKDRVQQDNCNNANFRTFCMCIAVPTTTTTTITTTTTTTTTTTMTTIAPTTTTSVTTTGGDHICPPVSGMTNYVTMWLTHGPDALTFDQAVAYCSGLGLKLAPVGTQQQLDSYYDYIGVHQLTAWANVKNPNSLSCYDTTTCINKFYTADGVVVDTTHFPSGIYVGAVNNEECLSLDQSGSRHIHAISCDELRVPICHSDCGAICPPPPASVATSLFGTKHYHMSTDRFKYTDVVSYCQGLDGGSFVAAKLADEVDFANLLSLMQAVPAKYSLDLFNVQSASACSSHTTCDGVFHDDAGNPIDTSYMDESVGFSPDTEPCLQLNNDVGNFKFRIDGIGSCNTRKALCEHTCTTGVDGGWSEWSSSGSCSVTCGGGQATQARTCTNPAPSSGGAECVGPSTRLVDCQSNVDCPMCPPHPQSFTHQFGDRFYKVSDSTMSSWEATKTYCESIGMEMVNVDDVVNVAAIYDMAEYAIWLDAKHSAVSGTCGSSGAVCALSSNLAVETIDGQPVNVALMPNVKADEVGSCFRFGSAGGGELSDFDCQSSGKFAVCVATCGGITCSATHPYAYSNGASCCSVGTDCSDNDLFTREGTCCPGTSESCVIASGGCFDAVVDGQWTEWVDDTACSVTCGSGVLMQTRSCTNPSPNNGGASCIGDEEQTGTTPCTLADCPEWDEWSDWSVCSQNCDYGSAKRRRTCLLADNSCQGYDTEVDYCTNSECTDRKPGSYFMPYSFTQATKDAFISSAEAVDIPNNQINAKLFCSFRCLAKRSNRFEFSSCNGFLVEDKCYLGYQEPSWLWEQYMVQGTDATIYFDINLNV